MPHLTRFADVVTLCTSRTADPLVAGIERFVGLEHIQPENLHIRSWGNVADGTTFTSTFKRGQVLFGKRRAYQRKVAVADFEGVCSSDIYVFESKHPNVLLPELLPFICQSEGFFDYAVKTSAGSLSPRTNWSHLANYEFPLSPLDEQRRIADLLWAADDVMTDYQYTLEKLLTATTSFLETQIANGVATDWRKILFDELLTETQYGISKKSGLRREGTVPILGIPNVVAGDIDLSNLSWVEVTNSEFEKYKLETDDILIVRTNGNPNYVGRCVALKTIPENAVYASYLIRLRIMGDQANPSFIEAILNSNYMRKTLMQVIRSSAGNYNLNTQGIRNQRIPLPSIEVQEKIMKILNDFNSSKRELETHIENTKKLKSDLLNKFLMN
ncbi:MAG: restriction endonuclease subunit S [Anaerolineales bacterium]|nr:restriction endonuclease subunit S [Anaerolineales bacterium]